MLNTAEYIIAGILSFSLFVFLILGIVLLVKLIKITNEVNAVIKTAKEIGDKTNDVMENVHKASYMASVSNLVKLAFKKYNEAKESSSEEDSQKGKK